MSTFVCSHLLPLNLLATNPAVKLFLTLFDRQVPQLFQCELVITSRTLDRLRLFINVIDINWSVLQCPKSSFHILIFLWIELVNPHRLYLLRRLNFPLPFLLFFLFFFSFLPSSDLYKIIVFFKFLNPLNFLLHSFLLLSLLLFLLILLKSSLILSYLLFLLN